jgi:sialate O-acetylesterase
MIPKQFLALLFVAVFSVVSILPSRAEVRLPNLFTDHMVLQRGQTLKIWGWAKPGEQVTVRFRKQNVAAKADINGHWLVKLRSEKAGGPDVLTIAGENTVAINDVLVGEVWVASGQSNMEWTLNKSFASAPDIAASANPLIRLFTVPKLKLNAPTNNVNSAWQLCEPATVPGFSAVAYYFARDLQKALNVPVGIIHTSWGGSPAEVWMSEPALAANPEFKSDILDPYPDAYQRYLLSVRNWERDKNEAEKAGKPFTKRRPSGGWKPTELYNGMIAPLIPYAIQGAIWYQGESNASKAWQYRSLFQAMIRNWRKDWGQGDFTFLAVQLAPWDKSRKRSLEAITAEPGDSDWAELREAQNLAQEELKKVGVVVITDVGEKDDIHPTKKQPVGARLALAARGIAYRQPVVWLGPAYKKMKVRDGRAILSFDHVDGGLEARGGPLTGFAICGENNRWKWAKAEIVRDQIVVSHPEIELPVAVRFGWSDFPVVNLYNRAGLPASPFRTDEFQAITMSVKP